MVQLLVQSFRILISPQIASCNDLGICFTLEIKSFNYFSRSLATIKASRSFVWALMNSEDSASLIILCILLIALFIKLWSMSMPMTIQGANCAAICKETQPAWQPTSRIRLCVNKCPAFGLNCCVNNKMRGSSRLIFPGWGLLPNIFSYIICR